MRSVTLGAVLALLVGFTSVAMAAEQPNIVIFLADDMGMGDSSAYRDWSGNAAEEQLYTPAMERLARRGVRFTDAHSPSSRCSPTRYALLTGRYCWRTSLKHWVLFGVHCDPLIERARITLPEFLQQTGYRTGMVGKWHLGLTYRRSDGSLAAGWEDADLTQPIADGPLDHGFETFYGISRSHGTSGPDGYRRNTPSQSIGPGWMSGSQVVGATRDGKQLDGSYVLNKVGNVLDNQAMKFLQAAASKDKPFFLYFASPANHAPYTPSESIGDTRVLGASRFVDGSPTDSKRLDFIYQNDVHIGRLMKFLEETPDPRRAGQTLIENTLFIFASDNGAEKANKRFTGPLRSNKGSVYEGGHRIPLIVSWPAGGIGDGDDATPGRTSDHLIALNDIYATVADILDRSLPRLPGAQVGAEDSFSQLPALRGQAVTPRPAIYPNDHKEASRKLTDKRAWVAVRSNQAPLPGKWKLFLDERFAWEEEINPQELYNLASDPQESNNLLGDAKYQPVVDYLSNQAREAAGDDGATRQP